MQTSQSGRTTSTTASRPFLKLLALFTACVLTFYLAACAGGGGVVPKAAKALTSQRFVSVAENASQYKQIFGELPNVSQEAAIEKNLSRAEQQGMTIVRPATSTAAVEFQRSYQQSSADVITLVGHNDKGSFKFSDGSSLPLSQVPSSPTLPVLAVISCESARTIQGHAVGLPTEITYAIAFRTEELFLQRMSAVDENSRRDLPTVQRELEAALDEAVAERNVRIAKYALVGTGSAGVVGVSIYQVAT